MPEGKKTLTEGKATILHQGDNVFYNPAQASLLPILLLSAQSMTTHLMADKFWISIKEFEKNHVRG